MTGPPGNSFESWLLLSCCISCVSPVYFSSTEHINHRILQSLQIDNLIWVDSNARKKERVLRKIKKDKCIWLKKE